MNKSFCCFNTFFLIFFITGCNSSTQISSTAPSSCFNQFPSKKIFDGYINFHQEHAESNDNSMRLLGCALYQKGDLSSAEKWLKEAYDKGNKAIALDFIAIYLKEGQADLASMWEQEAKKKKVPETPVSRWLNVIEELERYESSNNKWHLQNAQQALANKMKYESPTPFIEQFSESLSKLLKLEEECQFERPECSSYYLKEQRSYMKVVSNGVLSTMIPSLPIHWKYDDYKPTLSAPKKKPKEDS